MYHCVHTIPHLCNGMNWGPMPTPPPARLPYTTTSHVSPLDQPVADGHDLSLGNIRSLNVDLITQLEKKGG